jgi:hypothetical protein
MRQQNKKTRETWSVNKESGNPFSLQAGYQQLGSNPICKIKAPKEELKLTVVVAVVKEEDGW